MKINYSYESHLISP